jgi:hypothetical protein
MMELMYFATCKVKHDDDNIMVKRRDDADADANANANVVDWLIVKWMNVWLLNR